MREFFCKFIESFIDCVVKGEKNHGDRFKIDGSMIESISSGWVINQFSMLNFGAVLNMLYKHSWF